VIPAVAMRRQPTRGIFWLFLVFLIAAVPLVIQFVVVYTLRYWSFDPSVFGGLWPRRHGLLLHLTGGPVAILIGPIQPWLGENRRMLSWHRVLGKIYLRGVTAGCLEGFYLSLTTCSLDYVGETIDEIENVLVAKTRSEGLFRGQQSAITSSTRHC
jgi:hypothetical protein